MLKPLVVNTHAVLCRAVLCRVCRLPALRGAGGGQRPMLCYAMTCCAMLCCATCAGFRRCGLPVVVNALGDILVRPSYFERSVIQRWVGLAALVLSSRCRACTTNKLKRHHHAQLAFAVPARACCLCCLAFLARRQDSSMLCCAVLC